MKHYFSHILVVFALASIASQSFAQNKQGASDTIYHFEDKFLYKQQRFYEKWKRKAEKRKWTKELFNILCDAPTATTPKAIATQSIASSLKEYEGTRIEQINFKVVKPFSRRVNGMPTDSVDSKLERFGNRMHTSTRRSHLRRLLSFSEGDILDIKQLEENEEKLRSASYIDELYITVKQLSDTSIALNFLIKDRFSWSMSYQAHDLNSHKLKLYNKNLFGRGHYVRLKYYYAPKRDVVNNLTFSYFVPSIGRSFISARSIIEHTYHQDRYSLDFERPFIDYKTNTAGGITLNSVKNADQVPTNAIAHFPNSIDYQEVDAWAGFNIPYDLDKSDEYARYRKALTGRIYHLNFSKHPEVRVDTNAFLTNTTGALLGYNVSKRKLYLSNMMYNYGKVENIPYGYLAQLFVGGAVTKWQQKRGYFGLNFERAYYNPRRDHFFSLQLYGGTFFNSREFLDGLLNAEVKYISKLYNFRNTRHRHFLKLRYLIGFNPTDDFLNLNESRGLRNFESNIVRGDSKLLLNVEDVFFTPFTIAGFRTALFSFADVGYINKRNHIFKNAGHVYAGVGLGMRLHNDNFIFKTFQVSFSLFFNAPEDVNFFTPDAGSVRDQRFENFQISKPKLYWEQLD
ncbi:MAG: hypothetical protein CSB03_00145 [Bacteroidia bacterium]|nr:MAG: hypothetical protein CSB03_00145 [Bacteroidia bacterium]